MTKAKYLILLYTLLVYSFANVEGADLDFTKITNKNGLVHNKINAILKDSEGFVWFGTPEGLCRYDGSKITVFKNDPNDLESISDNKIECLFEDEYSTLWIGTGNGGMNRYNRKTGTFTNFRFANDTQKKETEYVKSISSDGDGFLWVGIYGVGLCRFEKQTKTFIKYSHDDANSNSLSSNDIYSVLSDGHIVWVATSGRGLDIFNKYTGVFTHNSNSDKNGSISDNGVFFVFKDSKMRIWIGTDFGLNLYEASTKKFKTYFNNPSNQTSLCNNKIHHISEDNSGRLWISTENGLSCLTAPGTEDEYFTNYYHENGDKGSVSGDNILSTFVDNTNILWLGTFSKGVNKAMLDERPFIHVNQEKKDPRSLSHSVIRAIYEDRDGNLWIGTDGGGLNLKYSGSNSFNHYQKDNQPFSLNHNNIIAIEQDKNGDMWFGTWGGGVNRLKYGDINSKIKRFTHYRKNPSSPQNIASNIIKDIFEDKEGRLWTGTEEGLYLYDKKLDEFKPIDGQERYSSKPNQISDLRIQSLTLFQDSEGYIWVGTWNGLNKILENKTDNETSIDSIIVPPHSFRFKSYLNSSQNPHSISSNRAISIFEDSEKNLWIGTDGSGLNKFNRSSGNFTHLSENDGLANNVVYSILEDNAKNLWMSTNNGLSSFSLTTGKFRNYEENDGLQSNYFYWGAALKQKNGDLLFGGTNGFNVFSPDKITDNVNIPSIFISNLSINGKSVSFGKDSKILKVPIWRTSEIVIPYNNDQITIEFVALNYVHPEKNQYAYKLEGFNDSWIFIGTDKSATYSNLSPGTYIFKAKGSNNDGIWNELGTSIKIIITPPYWATWWFRITAVLLVIGIILILFYFRIHSIKMQGVVLKKMVDEQTQELIKANTTQNLLNKELKEVNGLLRESNEEIELHRNHLEELVSSRTEELVIAKEKAEESERLKAAFLANMSHEIRTPLNAVVGFSSLLNSEENTKEDIEEFNLQITNNTNSLLTLIDDILDLSIIEAKQAKAFNKQFSITHFLEHSFKCWDSQYSFENRKLIFNNQIKKMDVMFYSDEQKIKQIIDNLMINACKFTAKGTIELGFKLKDGHYIFYVKDTGIGIAKKNLTVIFDYFRKIEDDDSKLYRGTGLGLAISKNLAELLGGKIWVESVIGEGSTFYFALPQSVEV